MKNLKNNIEVLSPAGDMERFLAAVNYGADAVYLAYKEFGMRTSPSNFNIEDLKKAISIAHENNIKVYLTLNTLPRNDEIDKLPELLLKLSETKIDAFIISDIGTFNLAKKYAPKIDIHMSTQTGIVNYQTAQSFYDMGAKRVVLARELSLDEISTIRAKTNKDLEIEAFVHGAMCMSFSGRCLISSYLTGRDANRGDCTQPCRWKYNITEENRPGQYFPIIENQNGTYLFNSRDLCMINYIPEVIKAGVTSLKIEGRAKSAYYVAVTTNAYKHAVNEYINSQYKDNFKISEWIQEEVNKISHREYNTGFFFGTEPGQVTSNGGYVRDYDVVAICVGYEDGFIKLSQRNKFFKGDKLDVLEPKGVPFNIKADELYDEYKNPIQSAPHAEQIIYIKSEKEVACGAFLRKKRINYEFSGDKN